MATMRTAQGTPAPFLTVAKWFIVGMLAALLAMLMAAQTDGAPPKDDKAPVIVTCPTDGMFRAGPSTASLPLVTVGEMVEPETIVGMIDIVMQDGLPVRAGVRGRIIEILVVDGQLVEMGQPLMKVEPLAGQPNVR